MTEVSNLPVFETVGGAIRHTLKHIDLMFRVSWPWMSLFLATAAAIVLAAGLTGASDVVATAAVFVIGLLGISAVAVAWHRALLLDQADRSRLTLGRHELAYLGYFVAIGLMSSVGIVAGFAINFFLAGRATTALTTIIVMAGSIVTLLIISRLHLVLPGVAVGDRRISLRESVELTRDNTWRIAGGFLLIMMLDGIVKILSSLLSGAPEWWPFIIVATLRLVVLFASSVVGFITLSYMSYCYWFFVPPPQEGDLA